MPQNGVYGVTGDSSLYDGQQKKSKHLVLVTQKIHSLQ
jgi:hypothetical protein